MRARGEEEYLGVVGEWLARIAALKSAPRRTQVLYSVHFRGRLFKDAQLTRPYKNGGETDVVPELDLLVVKPAGDGYHYSQVANVKVPDPRLATDFRADAANQNRLALEALRAHQEGRPVRVETKSGETLHGEVTDITGVDARTGTEVRLTGRIQADPRGVTEQTVLPRHEKHAPEPADLPFTHTEINDIMNLLRERQLMRKPEY
jgi:hypothetical protein